MVDERESLAPPPEPAKRSSFWRWILTGCVAAGLLAAAFLVPLPMYYAEGPGPVRDVGRLVKVSGAESYSSEGALYLTTVSIDDEVTFAEFVQSIFDPGLELISKEQFTGGRPYEEILEQAREDMAMSKQHAREVALTALGLGHPEGDGARVSQTVEGTPAAGVLLEGDVIVEVDGRSVQTTCDVGLLIDLHEPGDEIEVTVRRDGERVVLTVGSISNPDNQKQPLIGILMSDINYRFVSDVTVDIDTDRIGGPSAGLMFTLALYDRLTPDDLTDGRKIAGTGEIACDGGVGPIGGVAQKVAAAEDNGAEIFLSPSANFEDARAAAGDAIEVVSVATFADALDYLEDL